MWVVALVEYQFLKDNIALIGALHHTPPKTSFTSPQGVKIPHSVVYVGCYQPPMIGNIVTEEQLSEILKNVPSLLGKENLTFAYEFKIYWNGKPWIVTAQQGINKALHSMKFRCADRSHKDQLPLFYIYPPGLDVRLEMLAKIRDDYKINDEHILGIRRTLPHEKRNKDEHFTLTSLGVKLRVAMDPEWCSVCRGARDNSHLHYSNAIARNFAESALIQRSAPPSPQRPVVPPPSRPLSAPSRASRNQLSGREPFNVQEQPLLGAKHKSGCGCFSCGCCSVQ
ncbi:MAG: hypothetical protein K5Q00_03800 [Gammaproteobacteria bacterium]|nr:hypothetical protein [Gammaproteobacteria bacterium]